MSWSCPVCAADMDETQTVCEICGRRRDAGAQASAPRSVKWMLRCRRCRKTTQVKGETDYLGSCPFCGDVNMIDELPFQVTEEEPPPPEEERGALTLREVETTSAPLRAGSRQATGREPVFTGVSLRISRPGRVIGRGDLESIPGGHFGAVSEKHCLLRCEDGLWYVQDVGSLNRTRVNGLLLPPNLRHRIEEGSLLQLADRLFAVDCGD